jgi:hypothetical protein
MFFLAGTGQEIHVADHVGFDPRGAESTFDRWRRAIVAE